MAMAAKKAGAQATVTLKHLAANLSESHEMSKKQTEAVLGDLVGLGEAQERDVIGAFLRLRGRSINSVDPGELEAARRDAVAAKANLKAYLSAPVKGQLVAGDVWLAQLWNGDAAQARKEQPALAWALPKEGGTLWIDSLVVPASAPHPRAAHEFINFVLRPDVGAAISATTGYGTPNRAALPLLSDPVPYPSTDELARLEIQKDLGRASALWDRVWTEIKSA